MRTRYAKIYTLTSANRLSEYSPLIFKTGRRLKMQLPKYKKESAFTFDQNTTLLCKNSFRIPNHRFPRIWMGLMIYLKNTRRAETAFHFLMRVLKYFYCSFIR